MTAIVRSGALAIELRRLAPYDQQRLLRQLFGAGRRYIGPHQKGLDARSEVIEQRGEGIAVLPRSA